ncbi:mevalonate kinase [Saprolegnia parasitica CBS 223.65]|uniref:Mevalonate kinase n=1 Tax=Saprolegnia parasitica (strain CBS 223.65) TaxID=695850 RepID=A0A067CT61_SAPPC|nr:mevalonate kinase [Saprolegnia parasitica CBS 223.65]KDO29696.1 mevalonate kinase [Saprolegnia parasitica CBS 223.65]|eukprot:XP_012199753.1 mevalonate kinase [Saprolegnia parasitica CBS 223.65]
MVHLTTTEASAPGKVILFGEHAVVYGTTAIAASVSSLRVSARVSATSTPSVRVALNNLTSMKDGKPLIRSWPLHALASAFRGATTDGDTAFLPRPSAAIVAALQSALVDEHPKDVNALRPALFLLAAIVPTLLSSTTSGVDIDVVSGAFPVGAGLGSSAAFCTAVAAALLKATATTTTVALDDVNKYAFAAEVLLHDNPSGVDNSVATYGGAIVFKKGPSVAMTKLALPSLRILLTNTHVPRETKVLVGGVRVLYDADPVAIQRQFDGIEALASSFQAHVAAKTLTASVLAPMMAANQEALETLQVSHASIRAICAASAARGLTTKLTGAGGGGCTITLIPNDCPSESLAALVADLEKLGYTCLETALGGTGVEWSQ